MPLELSAEPLVRIIREFRPHVLITYDENGGYPHPDHIRAHELAMVAYRAASDPSAFPGTGEPWSISKVYYDRIFNGAKVNAVLGALQAAGHPRAEKFAELAGWMCEDDPTWPRPTSTWPSTSTAVTPRCAPTPARSPPTTSSSSGRTTSSRQAWPFDDFQLVESSVETTLPEDDLFAGIMFETGSDDPPEDTR